MRAKVPPELERLRLDTRGLGYGYYPGEFNGHFRVRVGEVWLNVMASDGRDWPAPLGPPWEHVSVSVFGDRRCPTWDEMCAVKAMFWADEECVVQFHPAKSEYVNYHPYTLHLWRPCGDRLFPTPPAECVGPKR